MGWKGSHLPLASLLSYCANSGDLRHGANLHARSIKLGLSAGNSTGNSIIKLYSRCDRPADAAFAFEDVQDRDVGSWNCLINGLSHMGHSWSLLAFGLFNRMRAEEPHLAPNSFTIAGILTAACASGKGGREAHAVALKSEDYGDVFVGSALVNLYCKLGLLSDAHMVFDRMPVRNSVTWATLISAHAGEGHCEEAFELFKLMVRGGKWRGNEFVATGVLSSVVSREFVEMGEQAHCFATKRGLLFFVAVRNSLITMYARCGFMDCAHEMFKSSWERSPMTWSAMVTGYAQNGQALEAMRMFVDMHFNGVVPSEYTFVGILNSCSDHLALLEGKQAHTYLLKLGYESHTYIKSAMVDMYAKCGTVSDARRGFDQISYPDIVLMTTMISGYVQNGENEEALSLYLQMRMSGLSPNDLTIASILRTCSCLAVLQLAKQVHAHILKCGFGLDSTIGSALSTTYAKCGDLDDSYLIFKGLRTRDVVAWNSMLSGFAQNGCGADALRLYEEMKMEGVEPNHVTFINLLSACSYMGLVGRGWSYFRSMTEDYGLIPKIDHYACMVDILSRAGLLAEAKLLVESAAVDHETCLWHIILGASVTYRKYDIGVYAGEKLMQLGTVDSSAYILLSNIYAASGKGTDMERVRGMMKSQGITKDPGCSWIEIDKRFHAFLVRDQLHPEVRNICSALKSLNRIMKDDESYENNLGLSSLFFPDVEGIDDGSTVPHQRKFFPSYSYG